MTTLQTIISALGNIISISIAFYALLVVIESKRPLLKPEFEKTIIKNNCDSPILTPLKVTNTGGMIARRISITITYYFFLKDHSDFNNIDTFSSSEKKMICLPRDYFHTNITTDGMVDKTKFNKQEYTTIYARVDISYKMISMIPFRKFSHTHWYLSEIGEHNGYLFPIFLKEAYHRKFSKMINKKKKDS